MGNKIVFAGLLAFMLLFGCPAQEPEDLQNMSQGTEQENTQQQQEEQGGETDQAEQEQGTSQEQQQASDEYPGELSGTTTITIKSSAGSLKNIDTTFVSNDVLSYAGDGEYRLKTRSMQCTSSDTSEIDEGYIQVSSSIIGTGSSTENYPDIESAPLKIRFEMQDAEIYIFSDPQKNNAEWVTYTETVNDMSSTYQGDCGMILPYDAAYQVLSIFEMEDWKVKESFEVTSPQGTTTWTLDYDYAPAE